MVMVPQVIEVIESCSYGSETIERQGLMKNEWASPKIDDVIEAKTQSYHASYIENNTE